MTTYYKATFSTGEVLTRATAGRKYSHAYLTTADYSFQDWETKQPRTGHTIRTGWAARPDLANKAMRGAYSGLGYTVTFAEVAPTVEISRQDYRTIAAIKKAGRS